MDRTVRGTTALARWLGPIALAYVLLLQTVLGFSAAAQHVLRPMSGLEEHCVPWLDGRDMDQPAQPEAPRHEALCCLLGCAPGSGPAWLGAVATAGLTPPPFHAVRPIALPGRTAPAETRRPPFDATGPPALA